MMLSTPEKTSSARPQRLDPCPLPPVWFEAQVEAALPGHRFQLADGSLAQQAASCLLRPAAGDRVLGVQTGSGLYITVVLSRAARELQGQPDDAAATLSVPGAPRLLIEQAAVELRGHDALALRSQGELDLSSAQAAVSINAQHLLASVAQTMVHSARHLVTRAEHCQLQASALLHLQAGQGLVTARDELKLDAERISLG